MLRRNILLFSVAPLIALILGALFLVGAFGPSQAKSTQPEILSGCDQKLDLNGTTFCTLDVTSLMVFTEPGYDIMKRPVTFNGVTFETVCPDNAAYCGNQTRTGTRTLVSDIIFKFMFHDSSSDEVGIVVPSGGETTQLMSGHTHPRAGVLLQFPPQQRGGLDVLLLVEAQS